MKPRSPAFEGRRQEMGAQLRSMGEIRKKFALQIKPFGRLP